MHGLTFRQAAATLLIVLLLGLLAGAIELYSDWKSMRAEIRAQTERTLQLVHGPAAEAAYLFNDQLAAQVVDGLFAYHEMKQVVLRDNFGKVIAQRDREDGAPAGALVHFLFGDITAYGIALKHGSAPTGANDVGRLEVALDAGEIAASFNQRGRVLVAVGLVKALVISALVVLIFYFMITRPLLALHAAITRIDPARPGAWPRPSLRGHQRDELGQIVHSLDELMQAFQRGLEQRDRARDENTRLGAELDVSRRIQQILLPSRAELDAIESLDIATYMEPASEVGGDYYDILSHAGGVRIGIGDVTGHGLESGVVMLMTQSAVRTMLTAREEDMVRVMDVLNSTIYNNVQRMGCGKNLTLALLDYHSLHDGAARGRLRISGQHESVVIVRRDGQVEIIDTDSLGFPIGLIEEVAEFVGEIRLDLHQDDVVVLYTDGITEAADEAHRLYGLERLAGLVAAHHRDSAETIKDAIVADVKRHIGSQTLYDDLTLVILKQR
ncbi:HAMP domain-containing protein [Pseudothauera rhizosphaerae]|uniref:HAMP domain-containing protein n=2 Tax=Pseudothauera rhizosphaerae TaxID=2565932 RepID=A0A4V3WBK2_9RHOO|nr:HAMP domain-containing protein [Pseudothauera rhizosphaerae]